MSLDRISIPESLTPNLERMALVARYDVLADLVRTLPLRQEIAWLILSWQIANVITAEEAYDLRTALCRRFEGRH
jgi:hypothetical protein